MSSRGTCNAKHAVSDGCPDPECYRYDDIPFAAVLRDARVLLGWTQQRLAEEVNRMSAPTNDDEGLCSPQYISDAENGRRLPKLGRARAFADALGVSLDALTGREQHRNGSRYPWRPQQ